MRRPWTGAYLRLLAIVLAFGGLAHIGNILGLGGTPWLETPGLWQAMDLVLLTFNAVVAFGLWTRRVWSIPALVCGLIVLQIIPYTVFRSAFVVAPEDAAVLMQLVVFEAMLIAILGVLLLVRK